MIPLQYNKPIDRFITNIYRLNVFLNGIERKSICKIFPIKLYLKVGHPIDDLCHSFEKKGLYLNLKDFKGQKRQNLYSIFCLISNDVIQ